MAMTGRALGGQHREQDRLPGLAQQPGRARTRSRAPDPGRDRRPDYVVSRAAEVLNLQSKSVRGSRVLVVGVAYKANIADLRESPAVDVLTPLRRAGADMSYADPHVPGPVEMEGGPLCGVQLSPDVVEAQDLVVITTAHDSFDWAVVREHARTVLDTRGWGQGKQLANWHTI